MYARTAIEEIQAQSGVDQATARQALKLAISWMRWKIQSEQEVDLGTFKLVPREDGPRNIRFNLKGSGSGSPGKPTRHYMIGAKTRWVFKPRKMRGVK